MVLGIFEVGKSHSIFGVAFLVALLLYNQLLCENRGDL
jgi:hypothetical protein